MRAFLFFAAVSFCSHLHAQTEAFERVLIPVSATRMNGAFGSVWSTELWGRNTAGVPIAVFPLAVSDWALVQNLTERIPVGDRPPVAPGQFLFFSRTGSRSSVLLDLRLFNEADPRASWGTTLPAVRDEEFRDRVLLINVPTADAFRTALRIYGLPESSPGQTVTIRYFASDEQLLASDVLPLSGGSNQYSPLYAQVFNFSERLRNRPNAERLTITVEGSDPAARLWAFVTVTANETQHVSVITPD